MYQVGYAGWTVEAAPAGYTINLPYLMYDSNNSNMNQRYI